MPGRLEIELPARAQRAARLVTNPDRPTRLLVMADFSGRAARAVVDLAGLARRPCQRVDFDNFDQIMHRLTPQVTLPQPAGEVLQFNTLEDFHPDKLLARVPALRHLNELRKQLADPTQFAQAAAALQGADSAASASADEALELSRLLGGSRPPPAAAAAPSQGLDALLRQIVAPSVVPAAPAFQAQYQAAAAARCSEALRALLHDPALQALEANWRSVDWLVSNLELDDGLQLHLLDVSREEMLADIVLAQGRVENTGLRRALTQAPQADRGWTVWVSLLDFGDSEHDLGLLAALGTLAQQLQVPLLAGAAAASVGAMGAPVAASPGWTSLRLSAVAPWIGVAAPRLLLRPPYGGTRDPIEAFDFDEDDGAALLWGSAAMLCAAAMARTAADTSADLEFGGWPSFVRTKDDAVALGGAEHSLGEAACQALLNRGVMPLVNLRGSTTVRLLRLQSLAGTALGN